MIKHAALFALMMLAQASYGEAHHENILFGPYGQKYTFAKLAPSEGGVNNDGVISVYDREGVLVYYRQTSLSPGCSGEFPPLSEIELEITIFPLSNYSSKKYKRKYILFCGNTNGRHNKLLVYEPYGGVVTTLDFLLGPVNLKKVKNGYYRSVVEYEVNLYLAGKVYYPVPYKLIATGMTVSFALESNVDRTAFYREMIESNSEKINKDADLEDIARYLLIANLSNDKDIYCKTKKKFTPINKDKKDLYFQLLAVINKINFNLLKCEEAM